MKQAWTRSVCISAVVSLGALVLAGCGSSTTSSPPSSGGTPAASSQAPLAHLLPADIPAGTTLTVPSSIEFPPFEYFENGTGPATGLDVDLANAIGKQLGINFKFINFKFETIIPAVTNGKFKVSFSSFSDTSEREKQVSFVDYFLDGEQILVSSSNPKHINNWMALCGLNVALANGDTDIQVAAQQSKKCAAAGKPALKTSVLPGTPQDLLAVDSGRADATITDAASGAYSAKATNGKYKMVGTIIDMAPYGIVFAKTDTGFQKAVQAALQAMQKSGEYQKILDKWEQSPQSAMKKFSINAAAAYGQ